MRCRGVESAHLGKRGVGAPAQLGAGSKFCDSMPILAFSGNASVLAQNTHSGCGS